MNYSLEEIKAEIERQLVRGQEWHYDYPSAQRLVNKHVEALQQAVKAITIAQKYANKAVQEWIDQQKAAGRWNR
jgi:hypothetical protein